MSNQKKKRGGLNLRHTLILFALVPLISAAIVLSFVSIMSSSSKLKSSVDGSMVAMITEIGTGFDYATERNRSALLSFVQAPIVKECLENPDDPELLSQMQQYTLDYYGTVKGWEGLYLADWNTKVLTHPVEGVIGKTLREGDSLKKLQNDMLSAEGGTYNVGIMTSPATGQLIMSLYAPVLDEGGNPIGYVGAGTYVKDVAERFSDVSTLGLQSAYTYYVDPHGTLLFHPDESKQGSSVENPAINSLIERIAVGEHPEPACVEYEYDGVVKYASYYVGEDNAYIAVLAADESDVNSSTQRVIMLSVIIAVLFVVVFTILAIVIAHTVANPLSSIAKALNQIGTGDVTAECGAKSKIREVDSIIRAFQVLKKALMSSMSNVSDSAGLLKSTIVSVDEMTANNAESVSQINTAIDEVAATSQTVAESAQTMALKAQELGDNIEVLNENVSSLYNASLSIKNANDEATVCMNSVHAGAQESVEAVQSISMKITDTNEAIEKIGAAVQVIESIAVQTNLLSLNASIEAARAGEAGRGFAVVADEIRTLADSSAGSAKEIRQIVENVVALSDETVDISNRVFEVINKEQSDIENAQDKFTILSESVESSIRGINTIREMAGQLDEIKENLANATTDLGAISEELGASAEEVAASCQTVTSACSNTRSTTMEMRSVNENMSNAIDFFKLS